MVRRRVLEAGLEEKLVVAKCFARVGRYVSFIEVFDKFKENLIEGFRGAVYIKLQFLHNVFLQNRRICLDRNTPVTVYFPHQKQHHPGK
jgi:hypothetical protein